MLLSRLDHIRRLVSSAFFRRVYCPFSWVPVLLIDRCLVGGTVFGVSFAQVL
jgi:hypothetical protein